MNYFECYGILGYDFVLIKGKHMDRNLVLIQGNACFRTSVSTSN